METSEKLVFNRDSFDNILVMLQSEDKENSELAFSVINNCDKEKSLIYIVLIHRLYKAESGEWKNKAPLVYDYMKQMNYNPDVDTSFQDVVNVLKDHLSPENEEFFFKYFGEYLFDTLHRLGYDFIESIDIKLKTKDEPITV